MQFIDLQKQYIYLKGRIDDAIHEVLNRSDYIMGKEVKEVEDRLAEYVGVKHCVTCANGTDALLLAMMTYGLKKGDAVFVPTFTFYASAETISLTGATPIFVDIDNKTFNIEVIDLERAILETIEQGILKPRAVVAVDLFGLPFDYAAIKSICDKYNLLLIEDGAQGFGGIVDNKKACSLGDIATTSFFPAKPLGCYGDGGAVFTNDDKICNYLNSLKVHGKGEDKYDNVRIGMNSRLDTVQAAVLIEKLKAFEEFELKLRNKIAGRYGKLLGDFVITPYIPYGYLSSYAQYSILLADGVQRNRVQQKLREHDIPSMIYYAKSMHQQTVYRNNPSIHRIFNNAMNVSERILNLPMHPYLDESEILNISSKIIEVLE